MDPKREVELARRTLVDGWQSFKKMAGDSWGIEQNSHDPKSSTAVWYTLPDRILAASPHLQGYDVPGELIDELRSRGIGILEALEILGID